MSVKVVVKLANLPKEGSNFVTFASGNSRNNRFTYPKFYIGGEFTKIENNYQGTEGDSYLISLSLAYEKDAEGKDTKKERLYVNYVRDSDESVEGDIFNNDNTEIGLGELNDAIVLDVKKFEKEPNPQANRRMKGSKKAFSTFYRVKVRPAGCTNHTYIGFYGDECPVAKGDTADFDVRLFSKTAYDEDGNVDMSDKHTWSDEDGKVQSNGYPALEIVKAYVRED